MRLLPGAFLLNLFNTIVLGEYLEDYQSQRYIIKHQINLDPVVEFGDETNKIRYDIGDQSFTIANLTKKQLFRINQNFGSNCSVELDSEIYLPKDSNIYAQRATEIEDDLGKIYLNDVPHCNVTVNNVNVFVLDSVIFTQLPEFSQASITNVHSSVDDNPCFPHGTQVASVIVGKNVGVITHGNIRVYGVGVFDCEGKGTLSGLINAGNIVLAHDKESRKEGRRSIVNFSGTTPANSVVDSIFKELYKAGIPVFVAAGNFASDACVLNSPARAEGLYTVGATQYPGNIIASLSNYGPKCVEAFFPGSPVTVVNVYTNGTRLARGTSFSSPIAAAQAAIELSYDLQATPDQIYQRITARTVKIQQEHGPIQVMLLKDACPITKKLFNSFTTNTNDNNKFNSWYSINDNYQQLCVKFLAKSLNNRGNIMIGLRQNYANPNITTIKIDKKISKNVFEHSIINNNALSQKKTKSRVVQTVSDTLIQIEKDNYMLTVSYIYNKKKIKLISASQDVDYNDISFSAAADAKVRYRKAFIC